MESVLLGSFNGTCIGTHIQAASKKQQPSKGLWIVGLQGDLLICVPRIWAEDVQDCFVNRTWTPSFRSRARFAGLPAVHTALAPSARTTCSTFFKCKCGRLWRGCTKII